MAAIASAKLIAELEQAVRVRPTRSVQMLHSVADLLSAHADRLNQAQLETFDQILNCLTDRVQVEALAQLSDRISDLPMVRLGLIRRLARHEDAAVASPVLRKSDYLFDEDLIEIAACRGPAHGLAIAHRNRIDEAIVDVLLDQGDVSVCLHLVKNRGAKFSRDGYSRLVRMAERNDEIANLLVSRSDPTAEVLHELLSVLPRSMRARLLKTAAPELRELIATVIENIEADICAKATERIDYSEAQAKILELNYLGKLNDSTVNRFATWREYRSLVAALSQLAAVPIQTIEPLLHESDYFGLIVACRASRLNWNTTLAVIDSRPNQARLSATEVQQGEAAFESLNLSAAQRMIRFGSLRDFVPQFRLHGDAPAAGAG